MLTAYSQSAHQPVDALVILLHGLGADGHDFVDIVPELSHNFNLKVLLPHAPVQPLTIAAGEPVASWYDILSTGSKRVINPEQLAHSVSRVHQIIQTHHHAPTPLFIAGFSQGGAVALECFSHLPLTFTGCLAMSTYLIHPPEQAIEHHPNRHTPLLMQHGTQDPVVPYHLGETSANTLKNAGFQVQFESYPMQHQVCLEQLKAIQQWLDHLLSP